MNLFYDLPIEIQNYILLIVQNNQVNIIIKYWYKYIQIKVDIINHIVNLDTFDPWSRYDSNVFFCASKSLSGKEDNNWWSNIITKFAYSISNNYLPNYLDISNNLDSYNLSICSCLRLAHKFNISNNIQQILFV